MSTLGVFVYGIGIQVVGIGLGLLITIFGLPFGPHVGGIVTVTLVGMLLSQALKTVQVAHLLSAVGVWSLAYVIIFQTVGFLWFPGLVKDLEPFSSDHLIRAGILFVVLAVIYAGELEVLKLVLAKAR